ncbi:MAG: S41 family peptidase [Gemmatimonadota bacterium]|nr:S41 family peptidase [Gemmatimonadota bacterium]
MTGPLASAVRLLLTGVVLAAFTAAPALAQAPGEAPPEAPAADTAEVMPGDTATAPERLLRPFTLAEDLSLFSQVLNHLRVNHPDSLQMHRLVTAAITAMINTADPFSGYIPYERLNPEKAEEFREGRYVPLPVAFAFVQGRPLVRQVLPGTRAEREDILPGDELVLIDGEPVRATSEIELEIVLSGPRGSSVTLGLDRWALDGSRTSLERTVRRERPDEGTVVPGAVMLNDSVGYVRILSFDSRNVADHLRGRVEELEEQGMKALILDLRDNGGGFVDQSAEIAGEFLPEGAIVHTMFGRKEAVTDTIRVERSFWQSQRNHPLVVLVNENTASASELVSGALQDHDRALVVGRTTVGKALVMLILPLNNGSTITGQIYINVGRGRTPCGRVIQRAYSDIPVSRYRDLRGEPVDTTGLPSCRSANGRTLYGGGGIRPDVILPRPPAVPNWRLRAGQRAIGTRWAASYVTERRELLDEPTALLSDAVADEAVESYLERVRSEGIEVPPDADTPELRFTLLALIADLRWGPSAELLVASQLDPEIARALAEVPRARELLEMEPAAP